jgi:ferredoxin-thioredoxin reductase catalytic subunit
VEFTLELIKSLSINEQRYGYWACPCRLAEGKKEADLDIICPCDYRDSDLDEYDACFCALYVSQKIINKEKDVSTVPERRLSGEQRELQKTKNIVKFSANLSSLSQTVWRCRVCGYLCARSEPPGICPICKAKKERFEKFI